MRLLQDACTQQHQGQPALAALQRALYNAQPASSFMELVYSGTFEQVRGATASGLTCLASTDFVKLGEPALCTSNMHL